MSKKRLDKKIPLLEPNFREILVCKAKNARPYLEIFMHTPENVFQQNLGTLFGVMEIMDDSADSSYVVNYLISVLKKEFFSNVKRGPVESFEAALHKANLALAKLAEHEHISWIGRINAICAVWEKNNIHLSGTGTACALLLRAKSLVNISESPEKENPNPLKTFEEVISGRLENGDKIIITTGSIFNIFSTEEIKRSAIRFSQEEFIRFLNTALINELDRAAVLIADVNEKKEPQPEPAPMRRNQKINAFSQQAFAKKNRTPHREEKEKSALVDELKKELEKTNGGFVNEKTGHIYIKDDGLPEKKSASFSDYSLDIIDRLKNAGMNSLDKIRSNSKIVPDGRERLAVQENHNETPAPADPIYHEKSALKNKIWPNIIAISKRMVGFSSLALAKIFSALKITAFYGRKFLLNRIYIPSKKAANKIKEYIGKLIAKRKNPTSIARPSFETELNNNDYSQTPEMLSSSRQEKRDWFNALSRSSPATQPAETESYLSPATKSSRDFLPDFGKIKNIFSRFSRKEKLIAALIVAALIVIPYFISKRTGSPKTEKSTIVNVSTAPALPLENDKNISRIDSLETVASGNFSKLANVNGKIFALKDNSIFSLEDGKEYAIDPSFQNPDLFFPMDDLNLIFVYKNGKIISLHANSRKYQDNNITVPSGSKIVSAASYLTYGYLLDGANNQVYRYPRAEGGFGEKTDWLKDKIDLSLAKDMAVAENIYITDGKNIWKFNRGKKQEFSVESTATPIIIDKLFTKPDSQNLYALDKTNSRIIKLSADGNIISQYYNSQIANALDFVADEQAQKIYISAGNQIESFQMQN